MGVFLWARYLCSAGGSGENDSRVLVPLLDILNHSPKPSVTFDATPHLADCTPPPLPQQLLVLHVRAHNMLSLLSVSLWARYPCATGGSGENDSRVLVPLLDILNHSPKPSVTFDATRTKVAF